MNSLRIKSVNWVAVAAMLALAGPLATSCSKDTNTTEVVENKDNKLRISVLGINNGASLPAKTAKVGSSTSSAAKPTIHSFSDVDVAVSVDNEVPFKASNLSIRNAANGLSTADGLRAEAVAEGVKYVLYLYEGDTFVKSVVLTSGIEGTIEGLNPDTEYTWVALSYNSVEDVPASSPTAPSVDLPANTDVLYASGTVTVSDNPTVGITFDHVYSRIGIELNTIGVFGEITGTPDVSVSGLNLASGTLNLLTGQLTAGTTTPATLSYADFENVDPAYNDQKIAYLYTAPLSSAQNFTVSVQGLTIAHADGGLSRTYFANPNSPGTFSFNITPAAGQSHHALLNIVESPLTTNHEGVSVQWARSNLYYRGGNGGLRNYAFYAENGQKRRADGYFAFEALEPMSFSSIVEGGDPCTLVYPAGLWRTPTIAEINSITTSSGVLGNVLGGILSALVSDPAPGTSNSPLGVNYVQYDITAGGTSGTNAFGEATSNSNNLRFFKNGQITNVALLRQLGQNGLLGLGLSDLSVDLLDVNVLGSTISVLGDSYNVSVGLWTSSRLLGGPLLSLLGTSVGAQGYHAYQSAALLPLGSDPFIKATTTAELLGNVDLLGIDLADVSLKNVRCVRAN